MVVTGSVSALPHSEQRGSRTGRTLARDVRSDESVIARSPPVMVREIMTPERMSVMAQRGEM
jgi:hypothetical protein